MRPNRFLIAVLCLSLAVPPATLGQTPASATPSTARAQTATLAADALRASPANATPANVAEGVFGVYGGAESRFANRPGEMSGAASLRAPLSAVQLPDLGDGSGGTLTPQAERRLGERLMRELRRDPDYLDDWLVRDYLNSVSSKLAAAAVTQYLGGYAPDFDLFAGRDPQINAFSMPGGFIGVNTGLIAATQTESELASVVGHEMGHVLQRHIARMLGAQERSTYAALAAMLAGLLAGLATRSGDLGMGIAMGGQAFAVDNQLRFSRAAEHEADRVGFQMLSAAGYDPYAMTAFFDRLDRSTMGDNGVPPYARTHPLTGERIADMEDRARRVPYRQPRQSTEYGFVRARARVLQVNSPSDYRDIASRLKSEIEDQTALNAAANWYGIALAQSLMGDYGAASEALGKARRLFEGEQASTAVAAAQAERSEPVVSSVDQAASNKAARRGGRAGGPGREAVIASRSAGASRGSAAASNSLTAVSGPSADGSATAPRNLPDLPPIEVVAHRQTNATAPGPAPAAATPAQSNPPLQARSSPSLDVLAADIARRAGRSDDAVRLADLAQRRWPQSHAAIDMHLQTLIAARRFAEAQALAKEETRAEPTRPDWWYYLAQSSVGLNDPLQQHQAMAEKFALDGAWPSAIRQLKEARDVKTANFYDLSTISARLRDFEARYREEREQEKNG
ncbi:M48 family metalloprotease [Caballeronia humi]|uniref:Peptidase M48, Ste24p n=1 Tax=Caballeronia humi TaxID=326474 RepID=A0A158I622_9BURK|nr:M48 family metalloprotease [Caballeronia humi]SAL52052.1 peptidase M48, Ste24p [Caballeronia humi]